jgi:phosphonate transport system substrate-binding protein
MNKKLFAAIAVVCVVWSVSCSHKDAPLGSKENPIKLFFTPSQDADKLFTTSKGMVEYLEKETGYRIKTAVPNSYVAVVEAFGTAKADVAFFNTFGYILANSKYGAEALLKVERYGKDYYQGQVIVRNDSGIKKLEDLKGKKFAYTDSSSTSGYLFPAKLLHDKGVTLGASVFGQKHDNVVTMVYQRQVDAGATFYSAPANGEIRDARRLVKTQFPDIEKTVSSIALTDHIPNDPVAFRKEMEAEIKSRLTNALLAYSKTEVGKKTLIELYDISGLVNVTDKDYDSVRATLKAVDADVASLVK